MKSILMNEPEISSRFTEKELDDLLCPDQYLGTAITQVERTVTF